VGHFKTWGCEAYVKRLMSTKLEQRSDKCFFVGYPKETRGYYFYKTFEGTIVVAKNGVFLEKDFVSKRISGRKVDIEEVQDPQSNDIPIEEHEHDTQTVVTENPIPITQEPCRSSGIRQEPEIYWFLISKEGDVLLKGQDDPVTYTKTIPGPES
jgi:hypothetical protein